MPVQIKSPKLPTTITGFYTVPQGVQLIVRNIQGVNTGGSNADVDIRIVPSGQTSSTEFDILHDTTVRTTGSINLTQRYWCLNPGDSIQALATVADCVVLWFFAEEVPATMINEFQPQTAIKNSGPVSKPTTISDKSFGY
mgnify:CR=1 FL=1